MGRKQQGWEGSYIYFHIAFSNLTSITLTTYSESTGSSGLAMISVQKWDSGIVRKGRAKKVLAT